MQKNSNAKQEAMGKVNKKRGKEKYKSSEEEWKMACRKSALPFS